MPTGAIDDERERRTETALLAPNSESLSQFAFRFKPLSPGDQDTIAGHPDKGLRRESGWSVRSKLVVRLTGCFGFALPAQWLWRTAGSFQPEAQRTKHKDTDNFRHGRAKRS